MKTKALYLTVALGMMLGFNSCSMDVIPSDELNSDITPHREVNASWMVATPCLRMR